MRSRRGISACPLAGHHTLIGKDHSKRVQKREDGRESSSTLPRQGKARHCGFSRWGKARAARTAQASGKARAARTAQASGKARSKAR